MAVHASIGRFAVSFVFVLFTQANLFLIPFFLSQFSILLQLFLTALVILLVVGFGSRCRKLVGLKASAPAFVVLNVLFVWSVYISLVRPGVSRMMDIIFNGEVILLLAGLCCIMSSNPGRVSDECISPDNQLPTLVLPSQYLDEISFSRRVRYCKCCKTYIKGFDHHCPAFGNCIGQNNHVLFMFLLVGFPLAEASYIFCSSKGNNFKVRGGIRSEFDPAAILACSTMLFSLFQVLWQAAFLAWHLCCVCFNIKTDEWINWKKYPEFQHSSLYASGKHGETMQFKNPYDRGIIQNLMEFLSSIIQS